MTILIIEDEKRNFNRLKRMVEEIDYTLRIEGPLTSVRETVAYLSGGARLPDLILADIRLSDGLSFDAFNKVSIDVPVVFITAYDEYALRAFKYNGIDYLLKPVDAGELAAAVGKARRMAETSSEGSLCMLLEQMGKNSYRYRERFLLPYRDGYKSVLVSDVNHIMSENKGTYLRFNDGTSKTVGLTMEFLEAQLNPDDFFRANRQYIVRKDSVAFIANFFNAKLMVRLKGWPDAEVLVSREKAAFYNAKDGLL